MIKTTSSSLMCWTILASIACGQGNTYSSPFANSQSSFAQPGQFSDQPQPVGAQPQQAYSGYAGFQHNAAVNPYAPAARADASGLRAFNISNSVLAAPDASSTLYQPSNRGGHAAGAAHQYTEPQYPSPQAPVPDYGLNNSGSFQQSPSPYYQTDPMQSYVPQHSYPVNSCDPLLDSGYFNGTQPCRRGLGIEAGPVFFRRASSDNRTLFFSPTVTAERIDSGEFSTGVAQGIEAAITVYDLEPALDLELRATVLEEWSGQTSQNFTGAAIRYASNPVIDLVGPRNATADFTSEFFSAEFNARYRADAVCTGMTLLTGVRMLTLEEQVGAVFRDPLNVLPAELAQSRVRNRLFGLQLGADQVLMHNTNWFIKVVSRIGVYGNSADQNTQLIRQTAPLTIQRTRGSAGEVALHGELGILGKIRLAPWANVVAGYRAIYVDGVAVAADQMAASSLVTGSGLDNNSSILMHGANVALELAF